MRDRRLNWLALLALVASGACTGIVRHKGTLVAYPEAVVERGSGPRRYALVVGIDKFNDPAWSELQYGARDAEEMSSALSDFDEVVTLTQPGSLTRDKILAALDRLLRKAQMDQDLVLVYLSSHGTLARDADGELHRYVVLEETSEDRVVQTGLAVDEVIRKLESARAHRRALIMAFCHSGEGKSRLSEEMERQRRTLKASFFVDPIERVSHATVILSASAWGETAREDDRLQHDVYTHFLLAAFDEGDRNQDGAVTISELHDYARDRTYYYTQGQQRPSARMQITGVDPIVLRGQRAKPGLPELDGRDPRLVGYQLWVNGQNKGSLPLTMALPAGSHSVQLSPSQDDREPVEGEVELQADQRFDLGRLIPPAPELFAAIGAGASLQLGTANLVPLVMPRLELSGGIEHWPWRDAEVAVRVGAAQGDDRLQPLQIDYRALLIDAGVAVGQRIDLGPLSLRPELWAGLATIFRSFPDHPDIAGDAMGAPSAGLALQSGLTVAGLVRLGLSARGGVLPLFVDDRLQVGGLVQLTLHLGLVIDRLR